MPSPAAPPSTASIGSFSRSRATAASRLSPTAVGSTVVQSGTSNRTGPSRVSATSAKNTWIANHTPRFRTTPTTAAVIADSVASRTALPRSRSMNGAPRKIHRKQGANVTHTVRAAPAAPAVHGSSPGASR